jgi:riboflavin kinase/FMN adenylyltransferase
MQVERLRRPDPLGWPAVCVAVGNFDGVHRGHRALVLATVAAAREERGTAAVLTFDPHPARVVAPAQAPAALMTLAQKARALEALGVDRLAVLPFTAETAAWPADRFAETVLAGTLGASAVVVGENFRFGRGRSGDPARLAEIGRARGFRVRVVPPVMDGGEPVSSSRIRAAVTDGRVEDAARLIGRPFELEGLVVRGDGRGRTIGFPTANLDVRNEVRPAVGVYACRASVDGAPPLPAVVNVGRRPTFGGGAVTVEAHLLDADIDLYGRELRLAFAGRLRDERRFDGPSALALQLRADVLAARARLGAGGEGDAI